MRKLLPLTLLFGCGIKANPETLPKPEVQIWRIGEYVYVFSLSGNIEVRGFQKEENYWYLKKGDAFCFDVLREGGKKGRFCVQEAIREKPSVRLIEEGNRLGLSPYGFQSYMLYPVEDGKIKVQKGRVIKEPIELPRDYFRRCYALAGVKGNLQSEPVNFCLEPKPPPSIPEVQRLELRLGERKAYLLWSYVEEYREFLVFKNGKLLGSTLGFVYEVDPPSRGDTFTVKVVHPLGFQSSGVSLIYSP
ncbi:MAG: hypothetical protein D6674_03985 [Acidobacteria bacterium]|jgi:hypothetical protein|nr:MAG: hypothetical protein D6674_03985 [Acidobacteriota bacterium]